MALSSTRVTSTADAVATVADKMTKLLEDINKVLEYNADQAIAWTPTTKVVTLDGTANTATNNGHGLLADSKGRLTVSGGALPTGLATGTDYFLVTVQANSFQLAATKGGAAIDFTGNGSGTIVFNPVPDYIVEESGTGNVSGRPYDRTQISNAIGSLTQIRNLLLNSAASTGDHLGTLNVISNPLS